MLHGTDLGRYSARPLATPRRFKTHNSTHFIKFGSAPWHANARFAAKKVQMGNRIETRGKAKYMGGVGTKITGITRRKFVPNLQKIHVTLPNGTNKSMRVCVQCIRSGVVRKTVKTKPFDVSSVSK